MKPVAHLLVLLGALVSGYCGGESAVDGAGVRSIREIQGTVRDLRGSIREIAIAHDGPNLGSAKGNVASQPQAVRVEETGAEIHLELAADVLFDFDKATLRPEAAGTLKQVGDIIRERAKGNVRIEGHTDAKGSASYNQRLSVRRAKAVEDWLLRNTPGLSGVSFVTQGYGARRPAAPNTRPDGSDDPAGRQKNRRVEIVIDK